MSRLSTYNGLKLKQQQFEGTGTGDDGVDEINSYTGNIPLETDACERQWVSLVTEPILTVLKLIGPKDYVMLSF